jgi:uncharacterized protein (TIGR02246 family)
MTSATAVRDTIEAANKEFVAAFGRGDAAGVAARYTQDGQLFPPNYDVMSGREAIQAFWQVVLDMGIKPAHLQTVEAERQGDVIIEVGTYVLHGEGSQVVDKGKYIVIWKQEGGQWKLHRDIFNTNMPAPEA